MKRAFLFSSVSVLLLAACFFIFFYRKHDPKSGFFLDGKKVEHIKGSTTGKLTLVVPYNSSYKEKDEFTFAFQGQSRIIDINFVIDAATLSKYIKDGYLVIEFKKGKETKDPADPNRSYPEHEIPGNVSESGSYVFYSHQYKWPKGNFIVKIIGKTITGTARAQNLLFGGSHEYSTGPTEELDEFELMVAEE